MSVIILNKEKNVTSFKAIKDVQKEMKFKKAGHGGTYGLSVFGTDIQLRPLSRPQIRPDQPGELFPVSRIF